MRKSTPILLSAIVLLIASLACALPSVSAPTPDPNSMMTALVQTVSVALTETARGIVPVEEVVGTPVPPETFTPEPPTITPTITLSPTPLFTSTPLVPQISVSIATNCRTGPGKAYDRVGALMVGQVTEVVGRDYSGNYWFIRNPTRPNEFCWLWGAYATLSGNTSLLPIFTPPPTPTPVPGFEAAYNNLEVCTGWWVDIKVANTGGVPFDSLVLSVRDTVTDAVVTSYTDSFTNVDGCLDSSSKDVLNPGTTRIVSSPSFGYDPTGHQMRATITLCTDEDQSGTCLTDTIKFTP